MKNKLIAKLSISVALLTVCLTATAFYTPATVGSKKKGEVSPQHKLSPEEWKELNAATAEIHTPFGVFKRVPTKLSLDSSEVAYSYDKVNAKTRQLIFDFGTFVKN